MATPKVPESPATHDQKRTLIESALGTLQHARDLDERDDLHVDKWTAWYDDVIPLVTDVKGIATAIEAECYIRRSERIAKQPISVGGQPTHTVNREPSHRSEKVEKSERSRMRIVGTHAAAAREYVKAEVTANRKVTRKKIVQHVTRIAKTKTVRRKPSPTGRPLVVVQQDTDVRTLAALDRMTDGTRRTIREVERIVDSRITDYLRYVRLLPWLTIDRTDAGIVFTIDQELRAICESRVPRPDLQGWTVRGFLTHIRAEITRRRKEAHDLFHSANWTTGEVNTKRQHELLDWIEEQLDRIP